MEKDGLLINIKQDNNNIIISLCNKSNYEMIIYLIDITILTNNCSSISKLYNNNQVKNLKSQDTYIISFSYKRKYNIDTAIISTIHHNNGITIFDPIDLP